MKRNIIYIPAHFNRLTVATLRAAILGNFGSISFPYTEEE